MKYQVLFSLKNNEKKLLKAVVCCCRDWHFKGLDFSNISTRPYCVEFIKLSSENQFQ